MREDYVGELTRPSKSFSFQLKSHNTVHIQVALHLI